MPFVYQRTIHFPDTDAAGVVFFPNYLAICHEAYEESLAAAGISVRTFFMENTLIVPVSKSSAEYLRPLFCGDKIAVTVKPVRLTPDTYAIEFEMTRLDPKPSKPVAHVRTSHVCIRSDNRQRTPLPEALAAWVDNAS
ncbi:thioesterase [Nibricoccus aquaticus]|uniref:Thioesterase n=1 Tax=Nibricoccus aquaticus TaxID=2576891 RepID=A0A290Q9L6_9BACT|nr:acyl-CoA thioesterase [Nibricoccus aquaticus]ATC65375.1 thioesterase [Nibricoccus aquaticus]